MPGDLMMYADKLVTCISRLRYFDSLIFIMLSVFVTKSGDLFLNPE
jgi:hypothetical protein